MLLRPHAHYGRLTKTRQKAPAIILRASRTGGRFHAPARTSLTSRKKSSLRHAQVHSRQFVTCPGPRGSQRNRHDFPWHAPGRAQSYAKPKYLQRKKKLRHDLTSCACPQCSIVTCTQQVKAFFPEQVKAFFPGVKISQPEQAEAFLLRGGGPYRLRSVRHLRSLEI